MNTYIRKLAIFFTTLVFSLTNITTAANAQLLDIFDDQTSNSIWENVNNLLDATNTTMSDIAGM